MRASPIFAAGEVMAAPVGADVVMYVAAAE
jgi:hypothetical protein